jgi:hypothetical protein
MSKKRKRDRVIPITIKPKQILLDESFLMCASGYGCDSTKCEGDIKNRKRHALTALLIAYEEKILLVLDDEEPNQVAIIYRNKYKSMSRTVMEILTDWLSGQGGRIIRRKPAKIKPNAVKKCNLKTDTLDPLLCRLAIACHGDAPIWTLDSDFWCASQYHLEIRPTCPTEALTSVR